MIDPLTDDERALLREVDGLLYDILGDPKAGTSHLKSSRRSGGGRGFSYAVHGDTLTGTWQHFTVVDRLPDGTPTLLAFEDPHLVVTIKLPRIQRWAESLPAELRERAKRARWPIQMDVLDAIVLEALNVGVVEQLELFADTGAAS